jgi:hypothetical protein
MAAYHPPSPIIIAQRHCRNVRFVNRFDESWSAAVNRAISDLRNAPVMRRDGGTLARTPASRFFPERALALFGENRSWADRDRSSWSNGMVGRPRVRWAGSPRARRTLRSPA